MAKTNQEIPSFGKTIPNNSAPVNGRFFPLALRVFFCIVAPPRFAKASKAECVAWLCGAAGFLREPIGFWGDWVV